MELYLPSPRNSVAAHRSLLQTLKCSKLLATTPRPPPVARIIAAAPLDVYEIPGVEELLKTSYPHVPFTEAGDATAPSRFVVVYVLS